MSQGDTTFSFADRLISLVLLFFFSFLSFRSIFIMAQQVQFKHLNWRHFFSVGRIQFFIHSMGCDEMCSDSIGKIYITRNNSFCICLELVQFHSYHTSRFIKPTIYESVTRSFFEMIACDRALAPNDVNNLKFSCSLHSLLLGRLICTHYDENKKKCN